MRTLDDGEDGDDSDIVFRDLILLTLSGFVTVAVLLLPHIGEPKAHSSDASAPPGNVMVEATWPPDLDSDVDLWVQAPGDVPVGYSNKGGAVFNLLRDDLGHQLDVSGLNYESSFSRGVIPGEYTVNLHLYRNRASRVEVPVTVVVSLKGGADTPSRQVLMSKVVLAREGEERTVFRFNLAEGGALVPGSVHSVRRPLRSGTKP